MSRLMFALLSMATITLATGCCCGGGGGYGACRPACGPCGAAMTPSYGAAYTPVAASACSTCQPY